ncbi:uncharacterized protein FOMMEDRAFT_170228 [Fomitiporia mediterranea MF3/22]|uniref:uncharacterized protein n=1 Tax=Fomitiporia mediterranea (strain MF3/22) TaxID=694068 RepID=UPI0004407554|nr:uncharacterized protein FOMMEDRAFT_170228 [Fomitiporia mediterranea MF3/22]EJD00262.1 hypothetical protein FOMMEDRAFT_170228 [Fomitiporia mediterranea MF3/22]
MPRLEDIPSTLLEAIECVRWLEKGAKTSGIAHREQYCQRIACIQDRLKMAHFCISSILRIARKSCLSPEEVARSAQKVAKVQSEIEAIKALASEPQQFSPDQIVSDLGSRSSRAAGALDAIRNIYKKHLVSIISGAMHDHRVHAKDFSAETALLDLLFSEHPFDMFTDATKPNEYVETLCNLNSPTGPTEDSNKITKRLACEHVEDFMHYLERDHDIQGVDRVAQSYLHVLEWLRCHLESDIKYISAKTLSKHESPWYGKILDVHNNKPSVGDYLDSKYLSVLQDCAEKVRYEIERERRKIFRIAICGLTKAGKSLFLNAIIGQKLLPSEALPCRIRHGDDQEPHLVVCKPDSEFCKNVWNNCEQNFQVSAHSNSSTTLYVAADFLEGLKESTKWEELPSLTRESWHEYKDPAFKLSREAHGEGAVIKLLGQVNDIARLCYMFDVPFKQDMSVWPLLIVKFSSFTQKNFVGAFEVFDLPGIDEATVNAIEAVRGCVYAIVPVVSLKDVSKNHWRSILPNVVGSAIETPLIICTHLDQFAQKNNDVEMLRNTAWKVMNPGSGNEDVASKCICCSSLLGFGAQRLLSLMLTQGTKPVFESIFDESRRTPESQVRMVLCFSSDSTPKATVKCATQICGAGQSARRNYERLSLDEWKDELDGVINQSGRHCLQESLTSISYSQGFLMHKDQLCNVWGEPVQNASSAKRLFDRAKKQIDIARRLWRNNETSLHDEAVNDIDSAFDELKAKLHKSIQENFQKEMEQSREHVIPSTSLGTFRFDDEQKIREFSEAFQPKAIFALETIKNEFLQRVRKDHVDKQVMKQVDYLAQSLSNRLDGAQKDAIIGRVIAETTNVPARVKEASLSELYNNCRQRIRDVLKIDCWKSRIVYYEAIVESKLIETLEEMTIDPLISEMRKLAMPEFERLMDRGRKEIESAINDMLKKEESDYKKELTTKGIPPSPEDIASSIATYLNFSAAASAMGELKSQYEKHSGTQPTNE